MVKLSWEMCLVGIWRTFCEICKLGTIKVLVSEGIRITANFNPLGTFQNYWYCLLFWILLLLWIGYLVVQGSFASLCWGRETEAQTQTACSKSKQLLHGCEVSRLLQNHNCVQPCPDSCSVCVMFYGALSAYRRESKTHRRLLLQEETELNSSSKNIAELGKSTFKSTLI